MSIVANYLFTRFESNGLHTGEPIEDRVSIFVTAHHTFKK